MAPPGLGFASPNEAALERAASRPGRRFYFDWGRTVAGQRKDPPDSPFTPAVGLVQALDVALGLIEEEGLEQVYRRHGLLGRATRDAARALELELLGGGDEDANVVTAIVLPESIDGARVPKLMRDRFGDHDRGRPGPPQGQDRPHRPLRLLRRVRHHRHRVGARDDPAGARPRGRAGRRRGRRAARARGGRARARREGPRQGEDRRVRRPAAARRRARGRGRHRLGGRRAREPHRRVRRPADPLRHAADRRPARAGRTG